MPDPKYSGTFDVPFGQPERLLHWQVGICGGRQRARCLKVKKCRKNRLLFCDTFSGVILCKTTFFALSKTP